MGLVVPDGGGEGREGDGYLLDVEARPDVDKDAVGVGELALDVERVGERDEDGFLLCFWWRGGGWVGLVSCTACM